MTEELVVRRQEIADRGRYVIDLPDGSEAEMTYGRQGESTIVADHTFVPPPFRGRGIAEKLVATAVADARREGVRIVPVCAFVAAQFRRHKDWVDLRG